MDQAKLLQHGELVDNVPEFGQPAAELFRRCLRWSCDLGESWGMAESLEGMALIRLAEGAGDDAALFAGAADALRDAIGARQHAFDETLMTRYLAQARVDPTAWRSGRDAGRAMPLSAVVALASD